MSIFGLLDGPGGLPALTSEGLAVMVRLAGLAYREVDRPSQLAAMIFAGGWDD